MEYETHLGHSRLSHASTQDLENKNHFFKDRSPLTMSGLLCLEPPHVHRHMPLIEDLYQQPSPREFYFLFIHRQQRLSTIQYVFYTKAGALDSQSSIVSDSLVSFFLPSLAHNRSRHRQGLKDSQWDTRRRGWNPAPVHMCMYMSLGARGHGSKHGDTGQ